jgi:hypothetical protein
MLNRTRCRIARTLDDPSQSDKLRLTFVYVRNIDSAQVM